MGWQQNRVSGGNLKTRTFAQIIEDENTQRNILEIQINGIEKPNPTGPPSRPKSLTYEDIGELLLNILEINLDECISFNFNTAL